MIIAIDFDGTCCTHDYPAIGANIEAIPVLKELVAKGHTLVLWTMRSGKRREAAIQWLVTQGVHIQPDSALLEEQKSWTQSNKLYAQLYIDDAALGIPLLHEPYHPRPFVDWRKTRELLVERGIL